MTSGGYSATAKRTRNDQLPAEIGRWALTPIAAGVWLSADGHDAPPNARAVAAEVGRLVAVVDASWPDQRTDELVSGLFAALASAGIANLHLVLPRASDRYAGAARTHGIDLIAPAADVSLGSFGGVCHGPTGASPWLQFSGDASVQVLGSVYPTPEWEYKLAEADFSGLGGEFVIDHIAAGVCLYRPVPAERAVVLTARSIVPDVARVTIVASADASVAELRRELEQLIGRLTAATALGLRLVLTGAGAGGEDAYAQYLADTFGINVIAPVGRWTATPDGRLSAIAPASARAGPEVAGAHASGWRHFWPGGSRVGRPADDRHGSGARYEPIMPERDIPEEPVMAEPDIPPAPTARHGSTSGVNKIVLFARDHRSSDQERAAYRASAARYQSYAVSVRRVLTQRPGLRAAAAGESDDAIVTDFAAILDFLDAVDDSTERALRAGERTDARVACVISGLRRLPSFTGVVFGSADVHPSAAAAYGIGSVLIEPAFVHATSSARVALEGGIQYVIWSHTGKRVATVAADAPGDEIIFAAGTAYKVLQVAASSGSGQLTAFLRELSRSRGASAAAAGDEHGGLAPKRLLEPLDEMDSRVLERLVSATAGRGAEAAEPRPRRACSSAPPIGIDSRGVPFSPR